MIVYLTYNDIPSGIYSSQVIDVIKFIKTDLNREIRLIALVSLRKYITSRSIIHKQLSNAWVLPMIPGVHNWRWNIFTLRILLFYFKPHIIIARSVLATHLAKYSSPLNTKIVYDARGAIAAEWLEYEVVKHKTLLQQISNLEKSALVISNFRISVSNALISYWNRQYSYNSTAHVIIPCTLNTIFLKLNLNVFDITNARAKMGYTDSDIVFVYSGSLSKWQSFNTLDLFITSALKKSNHYKFLFLGPANTLSNKLNTSFPNQVKQLFVSEFDVPKILVCGDYGLLLREPSTTNMVASPVKFAEYLSCGLAVIISEYLGDFTQYVIDNNCGYFNDNKFNFKRPDIIFKQRLHTLANKYFTKENFKTAYKVILQ